MISKSSQKIQKTFVYILDDIDIKDHLNHSIILPKNSIGIIEKQHSECSDIRFAFGIFSINNLAFKEFDPLKTGDAYEHKVCNVCNRLLPTTLFQKNQNGKGDRTVRRPSCNDCRKFIDGKDMTSIDKKEWNKVKPYMDFYECPICHKITIPGLTSKVVLDHNHKTGKPRAWICDSCNTGLGRFKDDIKLLKTAIEYLTKKDIS